MKDNKGKLAVLVGGQYGSEGKGAISAHIAPRFRYHVRVGSPNAGHTFYDAQGNKHVMQTIPCGWINRQAMIVIGRGALINIRLLKQEIEHIKLFDPRIEDRLLIDSQAGVLDERFFREEGGVNGEMHRRIGSTGEGVGPARVARINRDPEKFSLFGDIARNVSLDHLVFDNTPALLANVQDAGDNVLIEGTQGSALSLFHSFWPYCTSTDTNASGIIAETGVAPSRVTDVILVLRTYPIRVAGNSGPMKNETTWQAISEKCGREITEKTTVTKKTRRVAEWDGDLVKQSILLNAPTAFALTFCDYVDPDLFECDSHVKLVQSEKLRAFLDASGLERDRIKYFGTGPHHVLDFDSTEG